MQASRGTPLPSPEPTQPVKHTAGQAPEYVYQVVTVVVVLLLLWSAAF